MEKMSICGKTRRFGINPGAQMVKVEKTAKNDYLPIGYKAEHFLTFDVDNVPSIAKCGVAYPLRP
jgi:hypothetical protein